MTVIDILEITKIIPHRYPFILIDKVIEIEIGKFIKGIKNVTINEPFFAGHFPQLPVMPGVLILEALAQTAGILAFKTGNLVDADGKPILLFFAGMDDIRFKRIVVPGDQLLLESQIIKSKQELWKMKVTASVDGQMACSGEVLLAAKREL